MKRKSSAAMKIRAFDLDVKAVGDDGTFEGYGSVFGVVDSYNEVVAPGAFTASLAALAAKGRSLPVLWQHRTAEPIGDWTALKEDGRGLQGKGSLWLAEAPNARVAQKGMKTKSVTGLSIGYYVIKASYNEKTWVRTLEELELVEISIVTTPANDEARIDSIKSRVAHGALPDLPDFERLLCETGFSKSHAAVIANHGFKHLLASSSADTAAQLAPLIAQAEKFSLPTF